MKFLLDMPVSALLLDVAKAYGHQGVHAARIGLDRATDSEILEVARLEACVIVTADLDFPRLLALGSADGPGVVLFRGGNYSDREMCDLLRRVLDTVRPEVLEGSVCVVDKLRIRVAQLPLQREP